MRALEFKARIKNNHIRIPKGLQSELKMNEDKDVRVIVLIDDAGASDDLVFREAASSQFLKGYSDSDSVYDKD